MSSPIAYLRDLDGTGSLHPCAAGDPGAVPVYSEKDIARLRASHAEMLMVAKRFCIAEELDYPGDSPQRCGYECLVCQGTGDTVESVKHFPGCAIANAEKVT